MTGPSSEIVGSVVGSAGMDPRVPPVAPLSARLSLFSGLFFRESESRKFDSAKTQSVGFKKLCLSV